MFSVDKFLRNNDLFIVIGLIFGILILETVFFYTLGKLKPVPHQKEIENRTKSWWLMAAIFVGVTVFNLLTSYIAIGFLSFITLRELNSVSKTTREADRSGLIWCYLAVPVQFYLAYMHWYGGFMIFIPVIMFLWVPFMLVLQGDSKNISRSMAILPAQLMLCVFGISHLAYLLSLPELPGFYAGGRGLLLFLLFIVQINDVFQYTWGRLFGRYKVIPKINPNKTWEGLIGAVLTTTAVGYFLRFLTPLNGPQALLVSFAVSITGFAGDVVVSAIKRDIGIRDNGNIATKQVGILDRVDSLATSAPIFFHLVYFIAY